MAQVVGAKDGVLDTVLLGGGRNKFGGGREKKKKEKKKKEKKKREKKVRSRSVKRGCYSGSVEGCEGCVGLKGVGLYRVTEPKDRLYTSSGSGGEWRGVKEGI